MATPKVDAATMAQIQALHDAAETAVRAYQEFVQTVRKNAGVQPLTPLAKDGTWVTPDSVYR